MSDWTRDLYRELDQWNFDGVAATFWWRDDDARAPSGELAKLVGTFSAIPRAAFAGGDSREVGHVSGARIAVGKVRRKKSKVRRKKFRGKVRAKKSCGNLSIATWLCPHQSRAAGRKKMRIRRGARPRRSAARTFRRKPRFAGNFWRAFCAGICAAVESHRAEVAGVFAPGRTLRADHFRRARRAPGRAGNRRGKHACRHY